MLNITVVGVSFLAVFLGNRRSQRTSFIKEFNAPDESASRVRSPRALHNYVSMLYGNDVTKVRAGAELLSDTVN